MIYPKDIVAKYKEFKELGETLFMLGGPEDRKAMDKLADIGNWVEDEASIYAAEMGADKDGSYNPDWLFDDLEEQLNKGKGE